MTWEAQSVIALDSVTSAKSSITSPIDALSLTAKMPGVANPAWIRSYAYRVIVVTSCVNSNRF